MPSGSLPACAASSICCNADRTLVLRTEGVRISPSASAFSGSATSSMKERLVRRARSESIWCAWGEESVVQMVPWTGTLHPSARKRGTLVSCFLMRSGIMSGVNETTPGYSDDVTNGSGTEDASMSGLRMSSRSPYRRHLAIAEEDLTGEPGETLSRAPAVQCV